MKIRLFFLYMLLIVSISSLAQAFFDRNGVAKIYLDESSNIFYSYGGVPQFYLKFDTYNGDTYVYAFDGKHLGWLSFGRLYNLKGDIFLFTQSSGINVIYRIEPIKSIKQVPPVKKIEQVPPIKPILSNRIVELPSSISLLPSQSDVSQYNRQPDYKSYEFKPYEPPVNELFKAIDQGNSNAQKLINAGYVFYNGKWIASEEMARLNAIDKEKRNKDLELNEISIRMLISKCKYRNVKKITNGWYELIYADAELGQIYVNAQIKSNKVKKIYFPKKYEGFRFRGLKIDYDKNGYQKISLFKYSRRVGYLFFCFTKM